MTQKTLPKSEVRQHYDSLKNFEDKSDKYYFERRAQYLKSFAENVPKSARILNLGCGNGSFSAFLRSLGLSNIVDIELSLYLLRMGKGQMKILGDAENLPFKKNAFDAIIMTDVIEHIENRKKTIFEMHSVLKSNCSAFITYPNHQWVPMLNVLGKTGIKVDARDNKIPPEQFEDEIKDFFEITEFKTAMLMSKLPRKALYFFESVENKIPKKMLARFGLLRIYIIKKK